MNTNAAYPGTPAIAGGVTLTDASGTAFVDLLTAETEANGGEGLMVSGFLAASDAAVPVTLQFARKKPGDERNRPVGLAQVPAGAGHTTAIHDAQRDLYNGEPLMLTPGEALRVRALAAVPGDKFVDVTCEAAPM